jgi:hypothetical protein
MVLYGMDIRIQHFFSMIQNPDQVMDPTAFSFLQNSFASIRETLALGTLQQNLPPLLHKSHHDPLRLVYYNEDGDLRPANRLEAKPPQGNQPRQPPQQPNNRGRQRNQYQNQYHQQNQNRNQYQNANQNQNQNQKQNQNRPRNYNNALSNPRVNPRWKLPPHVLMSDLLRPNGKRATDLPNHQGKPIWLCSTAIEAVMDAFCDKRYNKNS